MGVLKSPARRKCGRALEERGQAMVEFVLILPLLLILLLALIQFGVVYSHYLALTDATRAASRALITCRFGGNAVTTGNSAAPGLTVNWDNGSGGSVAGTGGQPCPAAGALTTIRGRVPNQDLNVFGLLPTFKSVTLSSVVTVTTE